MVRLFAGASLSPKLSLGLYLGYGRCVWEIVSVSGELDEWTFWPFTTVQLGPLLFPLIANETPVMVNVSPGGIRMIVRRIKRYREKNKRYRENRRKAYFRQKYQEIRSAIIRGTTVGEYPVPEIGPGPTLNWMAKGRAGQPEIRPDLTLNWPV